MKLFAAARELAGAPECVLELGDPATVLDVRRGLVEQYAPLGSLVPRSLIAINAEYAGDETRVSANDEVALIPPVSGG